MNAFSAADGEIKRKNYLSSNKRITLDTTIQSQSPGPVAAPLERELIDAEVSSLDSGHTLLTQANFDVILAGAEDIPNVLLEIGRLREMTFRAVEEGTGLERDLDGYDTYYWHLFIWDRDVRQIVGGYRLGEGDRIYRSYGIAGFYVASLFHIDEALRDILMQSVELGRSFVIPEYQKKRLPLFLLWKGILYFLISKPAYRYLYGPVSVSKFYSDVSRSLIVKFVQKHYFNAEIASHIKPRQPFKYEIRDIDLEKKLDELEDLDALENLIETIEPRHIRLPVLLKQYIRQNARFIGFNLDPKFNDALDGLMILDLYQVREETIENLKKSW